MKQENQKDRENPKVVEITKRGNRQKNTGNVVFVRAARGQRSQNIATLYQMGSNRSPGLNNSPKTQGNTVRFRAARAKRSKKSTKSPKCIT